MMNCKVMKLGKVNYDINKSESGSRERKINFMVDLR